MQSKYGAGEINEAQYLAEIMIERIAFRKKQPLCVEFWKLDEWKKDFRSQLTASHALLKLYSFSVIYKVLQRNRGVYSLRARFLDNEYMIEAKRQEKQREVLKQQKEIYVKREEAASGNTLRPDYKPNPLGDL